MSNPREYGGRTIEQLPDTGFTISMTRYLKDRAREIRLERGRCKDPEKEANEAEIIAMRGLLGKLNWATREGMPQGAGDASLLSGTMPKPKVRDLQDANGALRRLVANDESIKIKPIPSEDLRLLVFADSSLANAEGNKSQIAHIVCATRKRV